MLDSFVVRRTFYKLTASLYVDCSDVRNGAATLMVTYDRRIVINGDVGKADVHKLMTPDGAERWLSETVGERGSRVEAWEWQYRKANESLAA